MKLYNYQSFNESNHQDIHNLCKKYDIENYKINPDGTIDVDGDVLLPLTNNTHRGVVTGDSSRLPIKFNRVSGYFSCLGFNLTTLEGSPEYVGGDFDCSHNKLTSLEGCPKWVGDGFICNNNKLTSLVGGPQKVMNDYLCGNNNIRDFYGFPEDYEGGVNLYGNPIYELFSFTKLPRVGAGRFQVRIPNDKRCKFIHLLNEYDVIRNGKTIIRDRLEAACEGIGLELPENIKVKGYEII